MKITLRLDIDEHEWTEWRAEFENTPSGYLQAVHAVDRFLRLRLLDELPRSGLRLLRQKDLWNPQAWIVKER